jgi:flagellar FliJ protein
MQGFQLQTVLDYRETKESLAQQSLAEAKRNEHELMQELERVHSDLSRLEKEQEAKQAAGLECRELLLYQNGKECRRLRIRELEDSIASARREVERKRQDLLRASREKKLLEKVKERQSERLSHHLRKQEQERLDEIATTSFFMQGQSYGGS